MRKLKPIFLDRNVWHLLFARRMGLATELPRNAYSLRITREAEFEIRALAKQADKAELHAYIEAQRVAAVVLTDSYFGFANDSLSLEDQRVGGFGEGRWISKEEAEFVQSLQHAVGDMRKSGLYKNEADLSLAARAMVATVITFDARGPLRTAYREGGDVIFLHEFVVSGLSLSDFVTTHSRRS